MENGKQGAFACPDNGTEYFTTWQGQVGLTKREYFAGLAMQGLSGHPGTGSWTAERTATVSVMYADALLKELDKPKSEEIITMAEDEANEIIRKLKALNLIKK